VGPEGHVTGLDMTIEQLQVAEAHVNGFCLTTLGYPRKNMAFVHGLIEDIQASIEVMSFSIRIHTNCVPF
jgi:arsenite methyltransferase